MTFSVGLKGVAQQDLATVETLIFDTLHSLADEGFEDDMIAAALNTIEFSLRENNTGGFPRGLAVYVDALDTWLYGRDPLLPIRYEAPLVSAAAQIENDPFFFQGLIRQHLLENSHRSIVILEPDAALAERTEAEEEARLAALKAQMSTADLNGRNGKRRRPAPPAKHARFTRNPRYAAHAAARRPGP